MYPSWGNYGGTGSQQSQNYGANNAGNAAGFGGSGSGSIFSSLQEQHLQQMQQLQMLHQKQLQSVLHHGAASGAYAAPSAGYAAPSWQTSDTEAKDCAAGPSVYYAQNNTPNLAMRAAPAQPQDSQPPPPSQPHPVESQPAPPPPEPPAVKPQGPDHNAPMPKENNPAPPVSGSEKPASLQDQQQQWYKQHLQNLQKMKQDKAKQNQRDGGSAIMQPPPPTLEFSNRAPPPPPPKEEPPAPPPPPPSESENVKKPPTLTDKPETPQDPEEAARLQQLQAAAAQWQHVQQQRAGLQYQALMQQHENLQKVLEKYQQLIQQPPNLQTMSAEMQLRHYKTQQQQFVPLYQDWDRTFLLWYEQFQSYPHKDQLQDYESQWKQWQQQMNATNAHIQERVAFLTAMAPFASTQYSSETMAQYKPETELDQSKQSVNQGATDHPSTFSSVGGSRFDKTQQGFEEAFDAPAQSFDSPSRFDAPSRFEGPGIAGTPNLRQCFDGLRQKFDGPRQRFDGPRQRFDGPRQRFDGPPQRFDGPQRFEGPPQRFDGPPQRFDGPPQRFDGPPQRFDGPPQRFDGPPQRFDGPPQRFDGPQQRFDGPQQRFDGPQQRFDRPQQRFDDPQRFDGPQRFAGPPRFAGPQRFGGPQRFDGPPRFDGSQRLEQPRQRFDGPQRFDVPRQRFDGPSRFDQPLRGPQAQIVPQQRAPVPPLRPPIPQDKQLGAQPKTVSSNTPPVEEPKASEKKDNASKPDNDLTDDSMIGNGGFFVQKDPIPQTQTIKDDDLLSCEKPKPAEEKPPISEHSIVAPKSVTESSRKGELQSNQPTVSRQDSPFSKPGPPKEDSSLPSVGRGRGQPKVPIRGRGRGRGQTEQRVFSSSNDTSFERDMDEQSYDYEQSDAESALPEEPQEYHWENPSHVEFHDSSEPTNEELWMPDEQFYPSEEEYYDNTEDLYMGRGGHSMMRGRPPMPMSRGGPPMGRGRPPFMRGGPPMARGGPPMGRGGPPMGRGGPPMGRGGPPMGRGGPPMGRGGPPMGRGGPPMGRGGPPMGRGGPPMGRGGPPMPRGGPAMARAGPPRGRGGPPLGRGGPPIGRGGHTADGHWEDAELAEYAPEEDQYWEEWGPPVGARGMRPPFPLGRGRPPRGRPPFTQGRPHPASRPLAPEHYEMDTELDPMYNDPHWRPVHPEAGRGRGAPSHPHEIGHRGEEWYEEEADRQMAYGREPPPTPHEIMKRDEMRPLMGRGRDSYPPEKEYEPDLKEGFVADYGHGEKPYRRGPDYPRDVYDSQWDRESPLSERRYPPRMLPPEPYRDDPWAEERDRGYPYSHDDRDRPRGEFRVREYGDEPNYRQDDPSYSVERSRLSPLPERHYPDYGPRPAYQDSRDISIERPAPAIESVSNLPEGTLEPATHGANAGGLLALSQRQHEIILKAAQELKMIRELQETTPSSVEPQSAPVAPDILPELPAGLLGLEIPADLKNVLKGIASHSVTKDPLSGDVQPATTDYHLSYQTSILPKTVDYAHGHEPGATVEKISYGERIILRPDPLSTERGYEKEPLGLRDPYSRDHYDRRDPFMDRREYSREREYREKLEKYERERYTSRDDRSAVPRSAYRERERERDVRDRDHSGSRDREHYGRSDYDRSPYRQSSLERERYSHGPSPQMERRNYEERLPPSTSSLPPPAQPSARLDKKPQLKNIDDILKMPGRLSRPDRIVIIMRGLPGSGKSHVAKLIRDKEVHCGGAPPRVIVLDDYFMTEVEKVEKDPDTGRRVKTKVLEYEYEPEMEETYRTSMLKTFKKTLDDGFFPFIILDTINDRVKHFDQFWSAAKTKGFEVYVAEITADVQTCAKRNVHGRKLKDISKMANNWDPSPSHMVCLDVRSILQDAAIEEVEMEDFNPDDEIKQPKKEEEEESDLGYLPKSKWEMDTSEAKLDRLDGLSLGGKRKREGLEDFLQLPDDYATRLSQPGKKRVRWADLEEKKNADLKRAIGFVVGQTDWERITDDSGQLAQRALNRTKYF